MIKRLSDTGNGSLLLLIAMIPFFLFSSSKKKTKLFSPDKKNEWRIFLSKTGKEDPKGVFTFENGMVHASGEDFGYVITEKKYRNFHLSIEFKWGEKKFPPRENEKRDGGILYHVNIYNGDKIWPRSLEYQVQEGDCGDFWMTDSTTIVYRDTLTTPKNWIRAPKLKNAEKPNGEWNKAEIIVKEGMIIHLLNGEIVNKAGLGNTREGNIVIQSEGAELFYRNAEIEEL